MAYNVTNYDGAFNDVGLVDLYIYTPMGTIKAENLGPADVAISATPGNGGNVMNFQEGSMGQLLANKSYKVKNWGLAVSFLRHSLDYCRGTYLIQEILNGNIQSVGILLRNRNFGGGAVNETDTVCNEILRSDCAFLVNFPGIEAGSDTNGDFTLSFKLSNAEYKSGTYTVWATEYDDKHRIPAKDKSEAKIVDGKWTNSGETL
jgi:hypothetical protein